MAHLTLAARGSADPDDVWERYAQPSRWKTWSPQIRSVTTALPRIIPGASGVVHGWFGFDADYVVDEVDEEGRAWSWTVTLPTVGVPVRQLSFLRTPMIRLQLEHTVKHDGTGAQTGLRIAGPLPVIVAYAPLAQLALRNLVRR